MTEERPIYKYGDIVITPSLARFGSKTYVVRNISSVELTKFQRDLVLPILLAGASFFLCGAGVIGMLFYAYSQDPTFLYTLVSCGALGVLGFAAGVIIFFLRPQMYGLTLTAAGSDVIAYRSKSKEEILLIQQALNKALLSKS